ncbi:V-type ATP synthase subunit A [Plantactinospora sp. WMMB334]|uniref:V-type ATP synthase subunit A n=1 Tax=Plantactinospora sp. WMMB334 TaxID=3404119 RepID=UPI003B92A2B6
MIGRVRRVNGPLVEVDGLAGLAMAELLEVGGAGLPAEVVTLVGDRATAQAYEYTGGVRPGEPVRRLGRPLAARLGPGLTGGVYDGLLRPLTGAGAWLRPDATPATGGRSWRFSPGATEGARVGPGDPLGTIGDAGPLEHRVLVPPGVHGRLDTLRPAGRYADDEPVAVVDGNPVTLAAWWPVRRPRPYRHRLPAAAPLVTGQRVLDAVFPVVKGGAAAVPGGFGTGKTVLLQQIAKWCDADVIVYVGCGERGNELADVLAELAELTDPRTGGRLADRTVLVANTSNMPIMAREASIYTGVTVAEYYRDMGYDTVVIADSTSRWAEALREFASRTGALPAEEGYPAGLASALAAFYERAGRVTGLGGREGSVTIIGAVSPPGGDLTEPVTAHTQRFVRTLWRLDRDLAYARHYPAVSWAGSYCRDTATIGAWYAGDGDPGWTTRSARMLALLAEADRLAALADLVGAAALPGPERVALLGGRLLREAVLQQSVLSGNDAYCAPAKSAALADLVLDVVDRCTELVTAGRSPGDLTDRDFSALIRAREETAPADADAVRGRRDAILSALELP